MPSVIPMPAANASPEFAPAEALAPGIWRRFRFVVALLVSVVIMNYAGGWIVRQLAGIRQGDPVVLTMHGLVPAIVAGVAMTLLLAVVSVICAAITHPANPHMGLFCALIGLGSLALRGGGVDVVSRAGSHYPGMALESALWALILLAEVGVAHLACAKWFSNDRWLNHGMSAPAALELNRRSLARGGAGTVGAAALGLGTGMVALARAMGSDKLGRRGAAIGVAFFTAAFGLLLAAVFAKTGLRGQAVFAAFAGFTLVSMLAFGCFPSARSWVFPASVPLAGILGYLFAQFIYPGATYPGHPDCPLGNILPIDFASAGAAGALWGYYMMFRWHVSELLADQQTESPG